MHQVETSNIALAIYHLVFYDLLAGYCQSNAHYPELITISRASCQILRWFPGQSLGVNNEQSVVPPSDDQGTSEARYRH